MKNILILLVKGLMQQRENYSNYSDKEGGVTNDKYCKVKSKDC